jgi:plastocyanin
MIRSLFVCTLLVLSGCGDDTTSPAPRDMAVTVAGDMAHAAVADMTMADAGFPMSAAVTVAPNDSLTFSPQNVDIAAGGTVTWTWSSANTMQHNVTSADTPAKFTASPTQATGTFMHTFTAAGTYAYYCTVHGKTVMFGSVIVH